MIWNLLSDDEVRLLDLSDQFLAFSQAYLDSAIHLCSMLVNDNSKTTYERSAAVLRRVKLALFTKTSSTAPVSALPAVPPSPPASPLPRLA